LSATLAMWLSVLSIVAAANAQAGPITDERDVPWVSLRDLTNARYVEAFERYRSGYRLIDVDAYPDNGELRYSMIWQRNTDGRRWASRRGMTSSEYHQWWERYRDEGLRPHDVEGYRTSSGLRFAGIWVENSEGVGWSSRRNLTSDEYGDYVREQRAAGRRPVDLELYETGAGRRIAAIFYDNPTGTAWAALRGMPRQRYQQEADERAASGFRILDFESYRTSSGQRYAAIWERSPAQHAWTVRSDRSERAFANLWRQYRDEGYRIVDFERYPTADGDRYAGVWIENASRFRYARKSHLDDVITTYRSANDLPGISVTVIKDGSVLYRRGFGWADVAGKKVAHSATVYNAASVSKVIGGTLAAKLEAERRIRDGTAVDLDLARRTDSYLPDAPARHRHRVDQLLAHVGCVGHYTTTPAIPNQTTHYDTAIDAVESIWDTGLRSGCTIGRTRSYSTAGFTFVGAVLEQATHRSLPTLIRQELAVPYGLASMRVQWATPTLASDYDRAVPYDGDNDAVSYSDSSWKVLGGGIEVSALDLARFGWKVLDGEIVDATARDARLWSPVRAGCGTSTSGACTNGIAWQLRRSPERIAEHGGSWTGARSFLRVYRDSRIVVAVMSNRRDHAVDDVDVLTGEIADAVLAAP
jgi:CubicO group peptidase (beta-lactamase class C family)